MVYAIPCKLATLSMLESHLNKAVAVFDKTTVIENLRAVDLGVKKSIQNLISGKTVDPRVEQVMLRAYADQLDQFLLEVDAEKPVNTQQGIEMYNKLVDVTQTLEEFSF